MFDRIITYWKLGIINLYRVGLYRVLLKLNLHPVQKIRGNIISGNFFSGNRITSTNEFDFKKIKEGFYPFGGEYILFDESNHPNWHKNYFTGFISSFSNNAWWKIPDFDPSLGDVKTVWELSRFEWVLQLAVIGTKESIDLINERLNDWTKNNPPYLGVNWKCGQEASIRVMHLISALIILDELKDPRKELIELIRIHLIRIYPTIQYAIGQENNHSTSEAAALFAGGHIVQNFKFEKAGRKLLEKLSRTLFFEDGCFSQYSTNYHRLVIDTYNFIETYRKLNQLADFSHALKNRIINALNWLKIQIEKDTGDVPNFGSNDGAKLFPFINYSYRDYRFTYLWGQNVWLSNNLIPSKIEKINLDTNRKILRGNKSGIFIFRDHQILLVFRRPIYNFRPKQADALHLDLWINGKNVIRGKGSYSYFSNFSEKNSEFSNNIVFFDDKEQMPRLSKFLYGSWLKEKDFSFVENENGFIVKSGFKNHKGCKHFREIIYDSKSIIIFDKVSGFKHKAVINWRLNPSTWKIDNVIKDKTELTINMKENTISGLFNFKKGIESKIYMFKDQIPVIEKEITDLKIIETKILWN